MGKFVCTRSMAVDGSFIWRGTYNFEKKGDYFIVKNAQGNNNVKNKISGVPIVAQRK